jgi:D-threo-aldose 1-dehydrogenase
LNHKAFGKTGLKVPGIIFGSSMLGNLYETFPYETKLEVLQTIFQHIPKPVVIDSAGKYGAGLALETLGKCLREMGIADGDVIISNKLGWARAPLTTPEPTFEPGVWFGLEHDAVQDISYDGILRCWEQGVELLGGGYTTQLVSVHDPDEYLDAATSDDDRKRRFDDVLGAYTALNELRDKGYVRAVGIGAKDWQVIREIESQANLDWVMLANAYTLYTHPADLVQFLDDLVEKQIAIVNAAVFNAGFLVGGDYFDYRKLNPDDPEDQEKFKWRERFFTVCDAQRIKPVEACMQFGKSHPGIVALALNTSKPHRIKENVDMVKHDLPPTFWRAMQDAGLLDHNYPHSKKST